MTHLGALTWIFQTYLLSPFIIKRIISPAKGREIKKQIFLCHLPAAFFMCNELVVRARENEEIREEISILLAVLQADDERARAYLETRQGDESWERLVPPCLVYWGFYGAWERFNVAPFRTPDDLSRQYLYGSNRKRLARMVNAGKQLDTALYGKTLDYAIELYLRKRGAAAKAFDLI